MNVLQFTKKVQKMADELKGNKVLWLNFQHLITSKI